MFFSQKQGKTTSALTGKNTCHLHLKRHPARVLSRRQGSGSSAASTPATSRKALRASAGRCNVQLTRPGLYCLSFIVILPTFCASILQPPRHLDIGAVCQTVLKKLYSMAQSLPPAPRGLLIQNYLVLVIFRWC